MTVMIGHFLDRGLDGQDSSDLYPGQTDQRSAALELNIAVLPSLVGGVTGR